MLGSRATVHCSMAVTSEPMSFKEVAEPYRPRFAECEFRYGMIIIVTLTSKQTRVKRLVYSAVMDGLSVSPSAIDVGKCFQLCYAVAGRNQRARRSCLRRMNDTMRKSQRCRSFHGEVPRGTGVHPYWKMRTPFHDPRLTRNFRPVLGAAGRPTEGSQQTCSQA